MMGKVQDVYNIKDEEIRQYIWRTRTESAPGGQLFPNYGKTDEKLWFTAL